MASRNQLFAAAAACSLAISTIHLVAQQPTYDGVSRVFDPLARRDGENIRTRVKAGLAAEKSGGKRR